MLKMIEKTQCCGCEACVSICPINAILMEQDSEGFYYPVIDELKCNQCFLCRKICPVRTVESKKLINETWAGYAKDEIIVKTSSSGGMFSLIAGSFFERNVNVHVAAAVWDENFRKVLHICSNNRIDLLRMKRSKYIQSRKGNLYVEIEEKLKEGSDVLFVGCPCEVAGLKAYLREEKENLFLIDLVCQGPTSPKVMEDFIDNIESKYNSKVVDVNMRFVFDEWIPQHIKIRFANGKSICPPFYETDIGRAVKIMQRPSCSNCQFTGDRRLSDITLGDYHGADPSEPYYNKNGTSIVLINTKKGRELRKLLTERNSYLARVNYEDVARPNPRIITPGKMDFRRERFSRDLQTRGLSVSSFNSLDIKRKLLYLIPWRIRKKIVPIVKSIIRY